LLETELIQFFVYQQNRANF